MKTQYILGYDKYDESKGDSVGVKEVLRVEDLMYGLYMDGKLKQIRILNEVEAIEKFGDRMSEKTRNKILNAK